MGDRETPERKIFRMERRSNRENFIHRLGYAEARWVVIHSIETPKPDETR